MILNTQRKVLVAEPEKEARDSIAELLQAEGVEPVLASDGRSALRLAKQADVDASIIDVSLPDFTGLQLFQALLQLKRMPCLFVGATESKEIRLQVADAGAWSFLPLPCSKEIVTVTIQVFTQRFFV